jgi:16S rRNA (guanine966-N2)-methyltransferase
VSLRIIAGRHRGRRIEAPVGLATRPTSDRAREALFGILEHGVPPLRGCRFLDLFAGSGAAALEAVSRGAASALCIDKASVAVAVIRSNATALGEGETVSVQRADACRLGSAPGQFDIAFLDPPYGSGLALPTLVALLDHHWLVPDARVVVEIAQRERLDPPPGLDAEDERRYGAARFMLLRASSGDDWARSRSMSG